MEISSIDIHFHFLFIEKKILNSFPNHFKNLNCIIFLNKLVEWQSYCFTSLWVENNFHLVWGGTLSYS